ncbi:MAG: GTPase ObgE [bacterium]|nr:GTPase ObgE [bacterium]
MPFIDEAQFHIKAGDGGDGRVLFRHEKYIDHGGPSGGDGGKGGKVYVEGTSDMTYLAVYRTKTHYEAQDAEDGGPSRKAGKDGKDLILKAPAGSIITNLTTTESYEVLRPGERIRILTGGKGGRGNYHFRSATNRTPRQFERGEAGEEGDFHIELRLMIDIGLVGMPNAGKSSLLNELTAAKAKVAAYPFTTIEPNLGMLDGLVLADIPGLIEGASFGKGLGENFLRHVSRAKALVHCISLEEGDIARRHKLIRKEMRQYDPSLLEKPEMIVLTKTDLVDAARLAEALAEAKAVNPRVLAVSIHDHDAITALAKALKQSVRD